MCPRLTVEPRAKKSAGSSRAGAVDVSQAELFSWTHRAGFAGQDMVDSISMSEDWVLLSSCKEIRKHREKQFREAQELVIASLRAELKDCKAELAGVLQELGNGQAGDPVVTQQLMSANDSLSRQNEELKANASALTAEAVELRAQFVALEGEYTSLTTINKGLTERIRKLEKSTEKSTRAPAPSWALQPMSWAQAQYKLSELVNSSVNSIGSCKPAGSS